MAYGYGTTYMPTSMIETIETCLRQLLPIATAMIYDATLQSPDAPGHAAPILPPAQPMITIISKLCCHSQQPLLLRPYYFAAT